jgi:type II secretion system protein G
MKKTTSGFTIVELLVVIVVIAILAAITVVAYAGIQVRARDNIRKSDIAQIIKAVELFKADNGESPPLGMTGWCTQIANPTYTDVLNVLKTYMNKVPSDPTLANTYQDYFYRKNSATGYTVAAELEGSDMTDDGIDNSCARIGSTANEYDYVVTR